MQTRLEQQIALWCIDNIPLIEHSKAKDWVMIHYERLVSNPKAILKEKIDLCGIPIEGIDLNSIDFGKASRSVFFREDLKSNPSEQLEKFLLNLDDETLNRIQIIFDYFGLQVYRADNAYPLSYDSPRPLGFNNNTSF
ncbi:hypothetical protein [Aestuariivivens sediminicola]|uniref:hypothetical protein n=1 Tax=Aestuariivivens sediminicola TaxID=2913560 RepID=UPI001F5A5A0C|nr:hypothetical protein [Aestuariivivens sediminicola]